MDLETVIKDIEEEQLFTRGVTSKIFKSMLNQPSLVSVNSANAVKIESENGYYTFKIDFPRPILDVDTIQLLTTSIPQANASIPNTAITFWYYRLSQYTGTTPSLNNLYCVRLLPSYYKPEFIYQPTTYGWNKTFNTYSSLSTELTKACAKDLGYFNLQNYLIPTQPLDNNFRFPFLPGDISITYNSTYNKFQMTGNTTKLAYIQWSSATPYIIDSVVFYTYTDDYDVVRTNAYTSLVNSNLNNIPSSSPNNWKLTQNEIVAPWRSNTTYVPGNIVRVGGTLYRAILRNSEITPPSATYWVQLLNGNDAYNYLITGYDDPNVSIMQGQLFDMPYEKSHYYQQGERMKFKNRVFEALTENSAVAPGNVNFYPVAGRIVYYEGNYVRQIPNTPVQNWTILQPNPTNLPIWTQFAQYAVGDVAYYNGRLFRCKIANTNILPTNFSTWVVQAEHPFDATDFMAGRTYAVNTLVKRDGFLWICVTQSAATPGSSPDWQSVGRIRWNDFNYQDVDVESVYFNGRYYSRNITTFNNIQPVPAWNANTSYAVNTFISDDDVVYRCNIPNQAIKPVVLTDTWSNSVLYEINDTTISNGTEYTSKVINLNAPPTGLIEWDDMTSYLEFQIVVMIGIGTYRALRIVPPGQPSPNLNEDDWVFLSILTTPSVIWTITSTWEKIGVSNWDEVYLFNSRPKDYTGPFFRTDMSGLNGLSELCDFIDNTGELNVKPNFPEGIPGQPFNIAPERLLNSILGFTWNGVFVPDSLANLYTDVIAGKFVSLYNRLRPVPNYEVDRNPALLDDPPNPPPTAIVTRTYTAEGYANLVYSSIVNIYTNVIGGSTLDTVRNTNLVATTSMNCGNLGIAFHANYVDTPLQRVAGDINELTIELRDEVGEPFYLTNNAIMTATFKVTYKDGGVRIEEPA